MWKRSGEASRQLFGQGQRNILFLVWFQICCLFILQIYKKGNYMKFCVKIIFYNDSRFFYSPTFTVSQTKYVAAQVRWLLWALCLVRYGCRHRSSHESGYRAFHHSIHWKWSIRQLQKRIQGMVYQVSPLPRKVKCHIHGLPCSKVNILITNYNI